MIERRNQIVQLVNDSGAISFSKLKSVFSNVSDMTLRNDLKYLDAQHLIVRVHGGAKSVDRIIGTDDLLYKRLTRNNDKKTIISEKSLEYIYEGASIFIDSGSTAIALAKKFPDQNNLIFTTGIHCALELSKLSKPQIYLIGGKLNSSSLSLSGSRACEEIRGHNYDVAFLGVTGYLEGIGFNCGSEEESELKKTVIKHSDTTILLMDSSKVGISNTFTFADISDIDIIISDHDLDSKVKKDFQNNKIKVV